MAVARATCWPIAENSAKKLKYSGRKKLFAARNWSGILVEIAEKVAVLFSKNISVINIQ